MAHYEFTYADKIRTLQFFRELNVDLWKQYRILQTQKQTLQASLINLNSLIYDCDDPIEYAQKVMILDDEYEKLEKEFRDLLSRVELVNKLIKAISPILTD